jgi:hypothetical protein
VAASAVAFLAFGWGVVLSLLGFVSYKWLQVKKRQGSK